MSFEPWPRKSLLGRPLPPTRGEMSPKCETNTVVRTRDDAVADLLRECAEAGLTEPLRAALDVGQPDEQGTALRAVRDLVYELAGAKDRDLAVDVLIYATGVAEFDLLSLRDYARKHGLSPEGFRQHVLAMQHRLSLPPRPMQHSDAS